MRLATESFLHELDILAENRKHAILTAEDRLNITGRTYYVSNTGDDANDGRTPETAWRSLTKVSAASLARGDGVLFRRGDLFRGFVKTASGVSYGAYGTGDKPKFYGWDKSLADPALWELHDPVHHIWKLTEAVLDCGTLVFNEGELHSRKLIPSYMNGHFVCRNDPKRLFVMAEEMTQDLDLVCFCTGRMTTKPSKGEDFPVPLMDENSTGELYLRCDRGNPGAFFASVEALPRRSMFQVMDNDHVTIDNLCLKYIGVHGISAFGHIVGLHVTNCEIGWIGGTVQDYMGTDPNFTKGTRGTVTRFGNGVEIYGGCEDYVVANCYLYQIYDAGITHQVTTNGKIYRMTGIRYLDNLVEYCVYSIEYFLEKTCGDRASFIRDCEMSGNILRFSGYGWGQQRHNTDTPAHIKGWSYENTASEYRIHNNIFDRAAYRILHLVAKEAESCPDMYENTYIQHLGMTLGQYGANASAEPLILPFDDQADETICTVFQDRGAQVYYIE
ncbi:MAG: hypothetical protein IJ325_07535 [Clostridia bacterium]|nr:hypothetical protein [Clostridia bacterium]